MESLGAKIRRRRRQVGLTLDELAARSGISKPYLSLIETDRVVNPPTYAKIGAIETSLNIQPGELLALAQLLRTPPAVRAILRILATKAAGASNGDEAVADSTAAALLAVVNSEGVEDQVAMLRNEVESLKRIIDQTARSMLGIVKQIRHCRGVVKFILPKKQSTSFAQIERKLSATQVHVAPSNADGLTSTSPALAGGEKQVNHGKRRQRT